MKALKAIGKIFLLATFLWGFYMTQGQLANMYFQLGYQECSRPKTEQTGVFLPNGAIEAISLEYHKK